MDELRASLEGVAAIEFVPNWMTLVDSESQLPIQVKDSKGIIALGSPEITDNQAVTGVYFYAGGRWSRTNRYELSKLDHRWAITDFQNVVVS